MAWLLEETGCCPCDGTNRGFCGNLVISAALELLKRGCVDSDNVRTSNAELYDPLTSSEGSPVGELPRADIFSAGSFSPLELAAAAAAKSFLEAFPRFLRSRAYSQPSPNSETR